MSPPGVKHAAPLPRRALAGCSFLGILALLFAASVAATVAQGAPMAAMGGMPMPGGWTMSMVWMRMPEQRWWDGAASYLAMWLPMMAAMMLPSLAAVLWRYRQVLDASGGRQPDWLAAGAGVAYLGVWTVAGMAIYPVGAGLAALAMHYPSLARTAPVAAAVVVLAAGLLQFTAWKLRCLACCRQVRDCHHRAPVRAGMALRHGVHLGTHCVACCGGLTAVQFAAGLMDLRVMAAVAAAITLERLAPAGLRAERVVGIVLIVAGLLPIARAAGMP